MDVGATLHVVREVARIASEWRELAEHLDASPFARPEWLLIWWSAFGRGKLEILTLRDDDERLKAVMPMARRRGGLRAPVNWHTPEFGMTAQTPGDRRELLEQAFGLDARSVELSAIDEPGTIGEAAGVAGWRVLTRTTGHSPYVRFDGGWDAYERTLSRNRRKSVRRLWRRLEETGEVTFTVHDSSDGLAGLLDEAFAVEASGWKGARRTAIASDPAVRGFYTGLAHWAAEHGWLRLSFLRLDGRPISADLSLEHAGRWYSLKAGYDDGLRGFGPGALHLHRLLRHACDQGAETFELLGDSDEFKRGWAQDERARHWLLSVPPSPRGRALYGYAAARERARPVARRLRRSR